MCTSRENACKLTRLVQHLVAFIKDEDANATKAQGLVSDESLETTRGSHDDVGASILILQDLHVGLDGSTTVKDASGDLGHVLAESIVLIANLVGQLARVAHDNNGDFSVDRLDLLESREDKGSSLP